MTVDELWQARAAAWELAARSLRYPGSELAEAAAGGEWDEAAGEILAALGLPAEVPAAAGDPAGPSAARRDSGQLRARVAQAQRRELPGGGAGLPDARVRNFISHDVPLSRS